MSDTGDDLGTDMDTGTARRWVAVALLALVAVLSVAGCGSSTGSDAGGADFDDADVAFAQSMIPHHEQAVEMARSAQEHASTTAVKKLADRVEGAQGPEITTMTGWLQDWGKKVPSGSMSGMDHAGGSMPGMMSDAEMKKLDAATGSAFDRMFLTLMISHHSGAVEMARTEQQDGQNPDAVALAEKIEADQNAQIVVMKHLLTR